MKIELKYVLDAGVQNLKATNRKTVRKTPSESTKALFPFFNIRKKIAAPKYHGSTTELISDMWL